MFKGIFMLLALLVLAISSVYGGDYKPPAPYKPPYKPPPAPYKPPPAPYKPPPAPYKPPPAPYKPPPAPYKPPPAPYKPPPAPYKPPPAPYKPPPAPYKPPPAPYKPPPKSPYKPKPPPYKPPPYKPPPYKPPPKKSEKCSASVITSEYYETNVKIGYKYYDIVEYSFKPAPYSKPAKVCICSYTYPYGDKSWLVYFYKDSWKSYYNYKGYPSYPSPGECYSVGGGIKLGYILKGNGKDFNVCFKYECDSYSY